MKYETLFPNLTEEEMAGKILERDLQMWHIRMTEQVDAMLAKHGSRLNNYDDEGWQEFKDYADQVNMPGICYLTVKKTIRNTLKGI